MTQDNTPRWEYRFENYSRALALLREAIETGKERQLSPLEKEGVIQRFEYTMELAWKTMKDYLESQGVVLDQITPRTVIREAFATQLINNGQVWMEALDDRNLMSHNYDVAVFERMAEAIINKYFPLLASLQSKLSNQHG